jgi:uncharacterized membrane protein
MLGEHTALALGVLVAADVLDTVLKPAHAYQLGRLSYLILSYLILSYLILSYLILSYLILSYLILSYLILSDLVHLVYFVQYT